QRPREQDVDPTSLAANPSYYPETVVTDTTDVLRAMGHGRALDHDEVHGEGASQHAQARPSHEKEVDHVEDPPLHRWNRREFSMEVRRAICERTAVPVFSCGAVSVSMCAGWL